MTEKKETIIVPSAMRGRICHDRSPLPRSYLIDSRGYLPSNFDPYHCDKDDPSYQLLFDEEGFLLPGVPEQLMESVRRWRPLSDGVAMFHINAFARKVGHPTIHYWR